MFDIVGIEFHVKVNCLLTVFQSLKNIKNPYMLSLFQ